MEITKRVRTETAHRLYPYKGPCASIHGHSYIFEVTIAGDTEEPMLMDFKDLKAILNDCIVDRLDHKLVLSMYDPMLASLAEICDNIVAWSQMTTAESFAQILAQDIYLMIANPDLNFTFDSVTVKCWETADSCATSTYRTVRHK